MVDYFVIWVDFKDKSVIYSTAPKNLNVHSCGHYDEHEHKSENVRFDPRWQLDPRQVAFLNIWISQEKDEEDEDNQDCAAEKAHNDRVFGPNFVLLLVENIASFRSWAVAKHICIKGTHAFSEHFKVSGSLADIFLLKFFRLDDLF